MTDSITQAPALKVRNDQSTLTSANRGTIIYGRKWRLAKWLWSIQKY